MFNFFNRDLVGFTIGDLIAIIFTNATFLTFFFSVEMYSKSQILLVVAIFIFNTWWLPKFFKTNKL